MQRDGFYDGIWDEHKWEAHLNEIEKKSEQLRKFIAQDPTGNIPRWIILLQENSDELDAVDAFIEEELQIEESYFPDDEDEDWDDEEFEDDLDDFFFLDEDDDLFEDDLDEGEEWKELSDDYTMSDYGSIDKLEIYNEARELAAFALQWAEGIHPKYHTTQYNDFISTILKIGAKIAGGYSFGFQVDYLGGNIACTKKGLYCANEALVLLQHSLKDAQYITPAQYSYLHERLFELRNDIGMYIQDLREVFYRSL